MTNKLNRVHWVTIILFLTLLSVIIATNSYVGMPESNIHKDWLKLFIFHLIGWYLWVPAIYFITIIIYRFPLLTNGKWLGSLFVHIMVAILLLLLLGNARILISGYYWGYYDFFSLSGQQYMSALGNRLINDWLIYILVLSILYSYISFLQKQEDRFSLAKSELRTIELENQLKEAELMALKLQLSPHFLFNSLHNINSLIDSNKKQEAIQMTSCLAGFLRSALAYHKKPLIPFFREIEFLDLYISIEHFRFKDRLTFEKDIQTDALNTIVPNLILQPIVENAIRHGISKKVDQSMISIVAKLQDGFLVISVTNNGEPLNHDWHPNIGLTNVISRLKKIYGSNYHFSLDNLEGKSGVQCAIKIPVKIHL